MGQAELRFLGLLLFTLQVAFWPYLSVNLLLGWCEITCYLRQTK